MGDIDLRFNLDELSSLVDLPRRTVRYYIQRGLIDSPLGVGRGSHYGSRHVEQLLEIRKWQSAGVSLERIGELLRSPEGEEMPPRRHRQAGEVAVCSHILLVDGVELVIDPQQAGLSPEQVREFASRVASVFQEIACAQNSEE